MMAYRSHRSGGAIRPDSARALHHRLQAAKIAVLAGWIACAPAPPAGASVERAFAARASGVQVEAEGQIDRLLEDDREGAHHQRFVLRLASGHTVLVAHNLDLAGRIPAREGERVTVAGEYEWNPKGGVIHWTHRDARGSHPGGFIEHAGRRYQ